MDRSRSDRAAGSGAERGIASVAGAHGQNVENNPMQSSRPAAGVRDGARLRRRLDTSGNSGVSSIIPKLCRPRARRLSHPVLRISATDVPTSSWRANLRMAPLLSQGAPIHSIGKRRQAAMALADCPSALCFPDCPDFPSRASQLGQHRGSASAPCPGRRGRDKAKSDLRGPDAPRMGCVAATETNSARMPFVVASRALRVDRRGQASSRPSPYPGICSLLRSRHRRQGR